ncbi:Alanine racemase [Leucobacter aridicollis]|uniref:alanine racemase n=1 Tax=Leucobacter aridicollis TaxID=283878 RepID=UPI0037C79156
MRLAEISVPALHHNIGAIRRHTGVEVIVVVKADAYGLGASIVAPAVVAAGAVMVAVASLDEALALRADGLSAPILCWLHAERLDYRAAVRHGITLGVSRPEQVRRVAAASAELGATADIHLKLDTGLSRNGAAPETWPELFATAAAAARAGAVRVTGLFSHLANAGDAADRAQAARFDEGARLLRAAGIDPPLRHLAASAAALSSPHLAYDGVRIGIAALGLDPEQAAGGPPLGLRPALTLSAEIVSLHRGGASGGERLLATLPIGFADGMPRALAGTGLAVTVAGVRAPLVGPIAMDECVVDVTHLPGRVRVGDRAICFGDPARGEPAIEEWSRRLGTINYEIIARLGTRVQRKAVGRGDPPRDAPTHLSPSGREGEV